MEKYLLGVVILNWNSGPETAACIEKLHKSTYRRFSIVVVDNCSSDGSPDFIAKKFPRIPLLRNSGNLGYAGGNRVGADHAIENGADLVLFLNPDTEVDPGCLGAFADAYGRWGAAVYGCLSYTNPDAKDVAFGGSRWVGGYLTRRVATLHSGLKNFKTTDSMPEVTVPVVDGMAFMVPAWVIKEHGFMDESFFLYAEEHDYCLRLSKAKIPTIFVPSAVVYHAGEGSGKVAANLTDVRTYYRARNRLVLYKRHYGWLYYASQCMLLFAAGLKQAAMNKDKKRPAILLRAVVDAVIGRMGQTLPVIAKNTPGAE